MEKTMTMNVKVAGSEREKDMLRENRRGHVTIWREILKDVRSQWTRAEYGRFHHRVN